MWEFLASIENSAFPTWVRETSSIFGYYTVLASHTFGMAFLVGLSSVVAARALGLFPDMPLSPMQKFVPLIMVGFWVNLVSGLILISLSPKNFFTNWDFWLKMAAIVCAIVAARSLRASVFGGDPATIDKRPISASAKTSAVAMLAFWLVAVTAGRLTAYAGWVREETAVAVVVFTVVALVAHEVWVRVAAT